MFSKWIKNSLLIIPAEFNAGKNCFKWDTRITTPLRKGFPFSIYCNPMIVPPVESLFGFRSPFTVFGKITLIIIDSFQSFIRRGVAHVTKKYSEIMPLITNKNVSTTIIFISVIILIITSGYHGAPRHICSCYFSFIALTVYCFSFTTELVSKTSTGFTFASSKFTTEQNGNITTITFTFPKRISTFVYSNEFYNCPSPKFLSGFIFYSHNYNLQKIYNKGNRFKGIK